MGWVCYPMFLQSIVPTREEARVAPLVMPEFNHVQDANTNTLGRPAPSTSHFDMLTRAMELEAENLDLRERVSILDAKCAENSKLIAQTPAEAVRCLQSKIAALENQILEEQTALSTTSRKAEIKLRGELDVCMQEITILNSKLEAKDCEIERYKSELSGIIMELTSLRVA